MKTKKIISVLALCLIVCQTWAQEFTSSNLPIVIIDTDDGVSIPDEPKVPGTMKIIWHQDGSRNYLSDIDNPQCLNYDGRIGIERRGYTSQMVSNKKPYGLTTLQADNTTHNNVSLLGMPAENDWILNPLAYDQTGMRDVLSYELSNQIGQYASRSQYCEVILNGDYRGLYVFMEKIKPDKGRVNIEKMDETCNQPPEVTGGYIVQANRADNDPLAWRMQTYLYDGGWPVYTEFIHHYPKHDNITSTQNSYIHNVFLDLEEKAHNHDTSTSTGIPSIIDVPSFVDFMLLAELTSNVDAYQQSTFFHKDRNGKLRAGPIWDYNLAYGYDFDDRSGYDVWQFDNNDNIGPRFWKDLFDTDLFRCHLAKRWFELAADGNPFDFNRICAKMDEIDALIEEAIGRDNQRWDQMWQHSQHVDEMKDWLQLRINWLNGHIGSTLDCSDVELPPLVISKIHYHPQDDIYFEDEQLEFIEITNNGAEEIDMTGFYFRELGISYCFPNGSSIAPHEAILLCSDSSAFVSHYGMIPFGQYTRHLSNKDQNLVLADAWGNIVDEVHYFDNNPWPWLADGYGPFLTLKDLNSDNSLPESWTTEDYLSTEELTKNLHPVLYPNPACNEVYITGMEVTHVLINNVLGQTIKSIDGSNTIDVSGMAKGIYLLCITNSDGHRVTLKLIVE